MSRELYVIFKISLIGEESLPGCRMQTLVSPCGISHHFEYPFSLVVICFNTLKLSLSAARSPVFSHTTSSLKGIWTIRSYHKQDQFNAEFCKHQDLHSEAWFMFLATSRWFGFRLDLIMIIFTTGITIGAVPLADCKYKGSCTQYCTHFYEKKIHKWGG